MPQCCLAWRRAHNFALFCLAACSIAPCAARRLALRRDAHISNENGSSDLNMNRSTQPCETYTSFILSVNSEFVEMSGSHLMAMIVDALQPSLTLDTLRDPMHLDTKPNWDQVSNHLLLDSKIDIIVFACQECNFRDNPIDLLQSEERLGKVFEKKVTESFPTSTKFPIPSKMFIGALVPRSSQCRPNKLKSAEVSYGNKGAVMIYAQTSLMNIAFVGAHLDASSPGKRRKNIKMIMNKLDKGYGKKPFDHVYIFGDLNYRLKALPASEEMQKECEACIEGERPTCNATNGCKWCHKKYLVADGECIARGEPCPSHFPTKVHYVDLTNRRSYFTDPARDTCQKPYAGYLRYFDTMFRDHNVEGHKPNHMYELVKESDTLHSSLDFWKGFGYVMPDYTANVPPTYKKEYREGRTPINWSPASAWYDFQTLVERGGPLAEVEGELASPAELMLAAKDGPYQLKTELKKCEFKEGCLDFGWLDRMMYYEKGETDVLVYRTLKMHKHIGAGDHSPLFMLLKSE